MQHINDVYGTEFPSPVGELHFSMRYKIHKKSHLIVSVPCRGTTFLNSLLTVIALSTSALKFPSPVGELHFSICLSDFPFISTISVPCRGTTFLNQQEFADKLKISRNFRPLSGNYISQSVWRNNDSWQLNFRPLSGNYISQLIWWKERRNLTTFPSPVGELHFSIKIKKLLIG